MVAPLIRKRYRVDAEHAERARATVVRIFAEVSEKLGSRRYLVGDRFGAADLTFASLAAASLMPEGHPAWVSDVGRMPEEFRAFVALIRREGIIKPWPRDSSNPRYHHTYLELSEWEYWTMGEPVDETTLINRALLPGVGLGGDVLAASEKQSDRQHEDDPGVGAELEQRLRHRG